MSQARIEALKAMAEAQPREPMVWYGLGNEFVKLGEWEAAANALRRVVGLKPEYTAAYQLLGTTLLKLGRAREARAAWGEGIEAADRTGAEDARGSIWTRFWPAPRTRAAGKISARNRIHLFS